MAERIDRDAGNDLAARVERAFIITIEGYDWNCPQHITPRFTEAEISEAVAPLHTEIAQLKQALQTAQAERALALEASPAPIQDLGQGPLALRITGIRQLTPRVRAYELRTLDGSDLPEVQARRAHHAPLLDQLQSAALRRL